MNCLDNLLKSNEKLKKEDIIQIQKWLESQPHLPKMTDYEIVWFLHSCNYSTEAAKRTIDNYFTMRTLTPEVFNISEKKNRDGFFSAMDLLNVSSLPTKTPDGCRILLGQMKNADASNFSFNGVMKLWDTALMLDLLENGPHEGLIFVANMKDYTFSHLAKMGIIPLKKFLTHLQEGMPIQLKGLYFFNVTPVMDKILMIIKPFLKKEIMDSVFVFKKFEDMMDHLPLECFPIDLGGKAEHTEVLAENTRKKIKETHMEYLMEQDKRLVDESKRPGRPKQSSDFFGIDGTFRQMEYD